MAEQAYGGFWIRFLAYLVDSVIFFTLLVALAAGAAFLGDLGAMVIIAAALLGPLLYWGLLQASARQATFGKALLGMKVTDAGGQRLSLARSLGRELAKIVSSVPLMLGFVLAAFTGRKQALHDMIASTTVQRETQGHVLVALVVGLFGWVAPIALVVVVGIGLFAGMMGGLASGLMLEAMTDAQKPQVTQRAPGARKAAPATVATQLAPAPKPLTTVGGDLETVLAPQLAGFERAGTTRAGPAVLELDKDFLFGSNFAIKTYLPPYREFEGQSVTMLIQRVVDNKGADIYDAASKFEKDAFFQRVDLSAAASPVAHLGGKRSVRLKSGNDARNFERAEGVVKLNIAQKPVAVAFTPAEVGKSKAAHGIDIALKATKGKQLDFQFGGEQQRVVTATGFGADQQPLRLESWGGGGGLMTYTFSAPAARVEILVAESLVKRDFPFILTRTSVAPPPGAAPLAAAPAAPPEAPKQASAPEAPKQASAPEPLRPTPTEPVKVAAARTIDLPGAIQPRQIDLPGALEPVPPRVGPKYNDLMSAVMTADTTALQELLAFGKWPDKPDSQGMTPLTAAALRGDRASAELLLKAGADPGRALNVARERGDQSMIQLLERYRATWKRL